MVARAHRFSSNSDLGRLRSQTGSRRLRSREVSLLSFSSPSPPSDPSHAPLGPTAIQSHDLNKIPGEISTAIWTVKSPPLSVMSATVTESDDQIDLVNRLVGSRFGAAKRES
ncbi:hypothetical protein FCV25MIE_13521 [Fagus crenata]